MSNYRKVLESYTSEIKKEWEAYGSCMSLDMYIKMRLVKCKLK